MLQIFKASALKYSMGFRPPGWYISADLIHALAKNGFKYLAPDSNFSGPITDDIIKEKFIDGLPSFTANVYPHQIERAVQIAKLKGILMVHMHIAKTEPGLVCVSKKLPEKIKKMLSELKFQTVYDPWFATLEELSEFMVAKNGVKIKEVDGKINLINDSKIDLKGLTVVVDNKSYVIDLIKHKSLFSLIPNSPEEEKVSVVLTVFNGESSVKNSLDSLVNQDYKNTEILVINDGSTDKTKKIVEEFIKATGDKRVKLISQENKGRANAKNRGLKESVGEYIAFCEDDAIYKKNYLGEAVKYLYLENVIGTISPHYVWNKNESFTTRAKDLERRRNFSNYKPFSAWVYKRKNLVAVGGFNEELEFGEDTEPMKRILKLNSRGIVKFSSKSLWLHREPAKALEYLKRKFRGGVGMANMYKLGITSGISTTKIILLLVTLIIGIVCLSSILISGRSMYLLIVVGLLLSALLVFRYKDIVKNMQLSSESKLFILLSIIIEYAWWTATFLGYMTGLFIGKEKSVKMLRGRK
jgi:glycosyltransferase involved in cell wall biosynthesis